MKILTKLKGILITSLSVVTFLCLCVGCDYTTVEDIKKDYGVSAEIVYYANGGNIDGNVTRRSLFYKAGDKPLDLGNTEDVKVTSGSTSEIKRTGYDFIGWYQATLVDGAPVFYEAILENGFFEKGERLQNVSDSDFAENDRFFVDYDITAPMDFSKSLEANQKIYLCAHWEKSEMLDVRPVCVDVNGAEQPLTVDGKTYSKEEAIYQETYSSDGSVFVSKDSLPAFAGYTMLGFVDKDGNELDWNTIRRTGTGVNQYIYAKYMIGEWTLVKTANELVNALKSTKAENFYLVNDIDCKSTTLNISSNAEFKGTIFGNGKVISNLSVSSSSYALNGNYSLFGRITESAVLKNFTLKNLKVEFSYGATERDTFSVNYFCSSVETGATIENVNIDGGSFKVSFSNATIINLDGTSTLNEWLGTELLTVVTEPTFQFKEKINE